MRGRNGQFFAHLKVGLYHQEGNYYGERNKNAGYTSNQEIPRDFHTTPASDEILTVISSRTL